MRDNLHNKTQNRSKITEKEASVLLSLFEDKTYRQFAKLYYIEENSVKKCAELMCFSERQTQRIKATVDKIAFYSLLNMVANSENASKLLAIRKILMDGDTDA